MQAEPPILELIDVAVESIQEAGIAQIDHVNWRAGTGEFWVIGGFHGSGKADLLATAAALQDPLRGMVKLFGRDTSYLREKDLEHERRRVGLVFENGGRTFGRLSVFENVALPLRYHANVSAGDVESQVRFLLDLLGLQPMAHAASKSLSPAWQQRVALARALTLKPELLLLDKPLNSTEVRQQRWWFEFLPRLLSGKTNIGYKPVALVVTAEDLRPWVEIGTHFALVKNNRWQALGNRAELKANDNALQESSHDDFLL